VDSAPSAPLRWVLTCPRYLSSDLEHSGLSITDRRVADSRGAEDSEVAEKN